jgi:hypothetical protein
MKSLYSILSCGVVVLLAGCSAANLPYSPQSDPDGIEFANDSLDVYPDDVRQDPSQYRHTPVAWAGIIRQSDAEEFGDGLIRIHTTFDHHYYDWEHNSGSDLPTYDLSPRGEGQFKMEWIVQKIDPDAGATDAQKYAAPGKMAIVYGVPEGVDADGVVKLRYRYLRMIDAGQYSTGEFDYGRFGQPVVYLK